MPLLSGFRVHDSEWEVRGQQSGPVVCQLCHLLSCFVCLWTALCSFSGKTVFWQAFFPIFAKLVDKNKRYHDFHDSWLKLMQVKLNIMPSDCCWYLLLIIWLDLSFSIVFDFYVLFILPFAKPLSFWQVCRLKVNYLACNTQYIELKGKITN